MLQGRISTAAMLRPLIVFIYYTGCRLGTAKKITWAMVSQDCSESSCRAKPLREATRLTLPLAGEGLNGVAKTRHDTH